MSTPENPDVTSGPIELPPLDDNGHVINPSKWLLSVAEEHGLDEAEMALGRLHNQGFVAIEKPKEPKHRAESEPDSTTYVKPPQGRHVAMPDWQILALKEEQIIRDNAPSYAQPRPRSIEPLTRRQRLNERRIAERTAEEALKAAGVQALRDSYAADQNERRSATLAALQHSLGRSAYVSHK